MENTEAISSNYSDLKMLVVNISQPTLIICKNDLSIINTRSNTNIFYICTLV